MPHLTIDGKTFEVEEGKRLVLAIEEQGINIGHRCGGYARCTTCQVVFKDGEPNTMTVAEYEKLLERKLLGKARLSCQITCDQDMNLSPVITLENEDWDDTGPEPEETVTPDSVWYPLEAMK